MFFNDLDVSKMNTEILFNLKLAVASSATFSLQSWKYLKALPLGLHTLGYRRVFIQRAFKKC